MKGLGPPRSQPKCARVVPRGPTEDGREKGQGVRSPGDSGGCLFVILPLTFSPLSVVRPKELGH